MFLVFHFFLTILKLNFGEEINNPVQENLEIVIEELKKSFEMVAPTLESRADKDKRLGRALDTLSLLKVS